jgi:hypothetical protein
MEELLHYFTLSIVTLLVIIVGYFFIKSDD